MSSCPEAIELGVLHFGTPATMPLVELARELEVRGIDSLHLGEHTHIPVGFESAFPGGGEMPDRYRRLWDPFVALMAVAASTSISIGTAVCLPAQHDPIVLAKTIATLDVLAGGRLTVGVGFGWNREEAQSHGVDPRVRRTVMREKVKAMQAIWGSDEASFVGEHVRIGPLWSWPKPMQLPHPPLMIGAAAGPGTVADLLDWATGWMPVASPAFSTELAEMRSAVETGGRDPATVTVAVTCPPADAKRLERLARLGVDRVVIRLPDADREVLLPILDRLAVERERAVA